MREMTDTDEAPPGKTVTPTPPRLNTQRPIRTVTFWIIVVVLLLLWLLGWRYHIYSPWIHLLLALALLAATIELFTGRGLSKDIQPERKYIPSWDPQKPDDSLQNIFQYAVDEAGKSTDWYWRAKRSKARPSQVIRFLALVLTAAAGLLPVIANLSGMEDLSNGLWASLLVGIAASLFGLDKAFGYSSGWARYVLTATNIRKALEDFRMEWAELRAKAGTPLTIENVAPMIARAKQFRSDVEASVVQETKDWIIEFQNTMAQMEKDVAAQMTALKTQVDKTIQAREAAAQPGSIQLTIQNSNKAAVGSLKVTLIDNANKAVQETITGSSWSRINLPPGQYQLKLDSTINNQPVQEQKVVVVKGGQTENVQITL